MSIPRPDATRCPKVDLVPAHAPQAPHQERAATLPAPPPPTHTGSEATVELPHAHPATRVGRSGPPQISIPRPDRPLEGPQARCARLNAEADEDARQSRGPNPPRSHRASDGPLFPHEPAGRSSKLPVGFTPVAAWNALRTAAAHVAGSLSATRCEQLNAEANEDARQSRGPDPTRWRRASDGPLFPPSMSPHTPKLPVGAPSTSAGAAFMTNAREIWRERRRVTRAAAAAQPRPPGAGPMKVFVEMPEGDVCAVWAEPTTLLSDFRDLFFAVTGIESGMQRWPWELVAEKTDTLASVGVRNLDTITFLFRLRGGMERVKSRERKAADIPNMRSPERRRSKTPASTHSSPTKRATAQTPAHEKSPGSPASPPESLVGEFRSSSTAASRVSSTGTARSTTMSVTRAASYATSDNSPRPSQSRTDHPVGGSTPLKHRHREVRAACAARDAIGGAVHEEQRGAAATTDNHDDVESTGHHRAPTLESLRSRDQEYATAQPVRAASEVPSSVWPSEPEGDDDEELAPSRNSVKCFTCPCCPGKTIETTNFKHLESHLLTDPRAIPDSFFSDPAMPIKRCPTCRKVWLQRKRGGGPSTCKKCSRSAAPRPAYAPAPRGPTPASAAHPSPAPARPPTASVPRDGSAAPHDGRPTTSTGPSGPASPRERAPTDQGPQSLAPPAPHSPPTTAAGGEGAAQQRAHGPPPPLPTLDEVCLLDVRTMSHVPKKLRLAVAAAWGTAWSNAAFRNTLEAWILPLMFAKVVLGVDPQQARGFVTPDQVGARLARWDNGEGAAMWAELRSAAEVQAAKKKKKGRAQTATVPVRPAERAEAHVREGNFSKGLAALLAMPSKARDAATRAALQALHPRRHDGPRPVQGRPSVITPFAVDETLAALRSFHKGSSAGALQIRPEFLREAADADASGGFIKNLIAALDVLQRGHAPPSIRPAFAGAALSALEKKGGGTRPIAAGESLRRVIAKILCARAKEKAAKVFAPFQFGVACKNGTERVAHRARKFWEACGNDPDACIVKWDFRNAFNSIARAAIFARVERDFPEMATWVWWTYGEPSRLWWDTEYLDSDEGVQQGDPLGPLLFSLALASLVAEVHAACPNLPLHAWYLDDGIVGGHVADVLRACEAVKAAAAGIGLDLNQSKCEVVFHRRPRSDDFPKDTTAADGTVRKGYKRIYGAEMGGFAILGTPIGTDAFVAAHVKEEVLARCDVAFAAIQELTDPHVAYCLLRSTCGFSRLVHILRTVPPAQAEPGATAFDAALRKATRGALRIRMPDRVWEQACLATSSGGLGLRQASRHRSAAYIASVTACADADAWDATQCGHWHEAVSDYNARVAPSARIDVSAVPGPLEQRKLSTAIETEVFLARLAAVDARDTFLVAHLKSVATEDAGLWLDNAPCRTLGFAYTPAAFTALIRWRLGLAVCAEGLICPFCKSYPADPHGYHLLTCRWGGNLGVRHDGVRDVFYTACQAAAWSPAREVNIFPSGQARAADVLVRAGTRRAFDFAVTHGCQPKYVEKTAASGPHAAGEYGVSIKDAKYKEKAAAEGVIFVAMVTDTHGNWSSQAAGVLAELARDIAARRQSDIPSQLRFLRKRLACAVMRGNARALLLARDPDEPDLEWDEMPSESDHEGERGPSAGATDNEASNTCPAIHQAAAGTCLRGMVVTA